MERKSSISSPNRSTLLRNYSIKAIYNPQTNVLETLNKCMEQVEYFDTTANKEGIANTIKIIHNLFKDYRVLDHKKLIPQHNFLIGIEKVHRDFALCKELLNKNFTEQANFLQQRLKQRKIAADPFKEKTNQIASKLSPRKTNEKATADLSNMIAELCKEKYKKLAQCNDSELKMIIEKKYAVKQRELMAEYALIGSSSFINNDRKVFYTNVKRRKKQNNKEN